MFSNFIKFILTATVFSPILFSYWLVNTIYNWKNLSFYIDINSQSEILKGLGEIIETNYLLVLFFVIVIICNYLLQRATKSLPVYSIDVKSIKPADGNFDKTIFGYFLPWIKLATNNDINQYFVFGFIFLFIIYVIIVKNSYHYNLIFRILLGFHNYEIQTKKEVTYLLLSKSKIINSNQVTKYVTLMDHMIINKN